MHALRPYQTKASDAAFSCYQKVDNCLTVIPTAGGKSLVIADVCKRLPDRRILVANHVQEIVEQDAGEIRALLRDDDVGIYCDGLGEKNIHARIVVGSIQSLEAINHKKHGFDLIIIDEAHRIGPDSETQYRKVIRRQAVPVLGMTATPYRLDQGLLYGDEDKHLFSRVDYEVSVADLIEQGYLAPLRCIATEQQYDLSAVKRDSGEFHLGELADAVMSGNQTARMVAQLVLEADWCGSWLIYAVTVAHAEQIQDCLRGHKVDAEVISSETPKDARAKLSERFRAGDLTALISVGCLTTGFNAPNANLIAVMRPTWSPGLHAQILGRGMRLFPGKRYSRVLDFASNVDRHGLVTNIRLPDKHKRQQAWWQRHGWRPGCLVSVCRKCASYVRNGADFCRWCRTKQENPGQYKGHTRAVCGEKTSLDDAQELLPALQAKGMSTFSSRDLQRARLIKGATATRYDDALDRLLRDECIRQIEDGEPRVGRPKKMYALS